MLRHTLWQLAPLVTVLAAACFAADALPLRTIAQGPFSGVKKAQSLVITTPAAWEKLWAEHATRTDSSGKKEPAPKVDFGKEMVLAVFMGQRPTGGFAVQIREAKLDGEKLVVTYAERSPGPDSIVTQALTAPYALVAVPKSSKPVEWKKASGPEGKG